MRRTVLLLASMVLAVLFISGVALVTLKERAQAAFPGKNGEITFVRGTDNESEDREIYVMDQDGSGQTRLTNNTTVDSLPAFSPDGERIAFTSRRDGNDEIYVMDAVDSNNDGDGDNLTRLTNTPVNEFQPAFSPDGQRMAFTSNQTRNNEVYLMDTNPNTDDTPIRLTKNAARDARPAFSPNGQRIAFTSNRDGDDEIFIMDAQDIDPADGNGDHLTQLTHNTANDTHANFSPDGKEVAFSSNRSDANAEIFSMDAVDQDGDGNGDNLIQLTHNPAIDEFPAFSPDGKEVAFSSNRDGNFEIYVISLDGTQTPTPLTDNLVADSKPDWGPFLYDFGGFHKPVDNLPTVNVRKAGSAVPVKFTLGGDQGLDILAEGYPKSQQIKCDSRALVDGIEQTVTAGESGLSYDASTDQYTYVWKSAKAWSGTCRQFVMKLDDGNFHRATFKFK